MGTCSRCDAELPAAARFCPGCGTRAAAGPRAVSWHEAERRYVGVLPGRGLARRIAVRLRRLRALCVSRMRLLRDAALAVFRARLELVRAHRRRSTLTRRRARAVYALGEAAYRADGEAADDARSELEAIDGQLASLERELEAVVWRAHEQIAQSRRDEGQTVAAGVQQDLR